MLSWKTYRNSIILIIFILGFDTVLSKDEIDNQIEKINEVIKAASGSHVDNVESKKLVDAAIRGLLKELDPYSYYFTNEELEDIANNRSGSFYGVGFSSIWINDTLQIVNIAPNSPAEIAGLRIGDKILRINDNKIIAMDKFKVEKMFKGDKNTPLVFDIIKAGTNEIKNFRLRKVRLPLNSVDASYMIDGTSIGYIAVNRFMNSTYYEVLDSLSMLSERGMESLIIDFRGNPGGLIDQTYMFADEFISDGDDIIITKGKDPQFNIRYRSSPSGRFEKLPVVILIDSSTISAPEIFAGAIQDLDRGIIVGKTSYGKGVVQNPIKLSDGSELWLTVAKYFTPSGRSIHKDTTKYGKAQSRFEDRLILKDGMIFSHSVEVEPDYIHGDSVPVFTSKKGRPIYGGGGITPDFYVEESSFSEFTQSLINKNILVKIALDIFISQGDSLIEKFYDDYQGFQNDFIINDDIKDKIRHLAEINKIDWENDKYIIDDELIKVSIKSIIAGMVWSNNEKYRILNSASNQFNKAVEVMPVAEKILDFRSE
ncbi:MAG: PDZ domain-containing protein [Candidatus Kapabacteria bacterium]|nr:PDZ domain-containing protein [Ignavibacteriota bacterium]MCW5885263.1 PDZ domain-containing protein [Candidatus Kapabacteria bacterium]